MTYETLVVEREGPVAVVTMNRPDKRNAMSQTMFREIAECFEALASDADVRTVVLTGAGGAFSSGADLTPDESPATDAPGAYARMQVVSRMVRAVGDCPKPVVAAVEGVAVGAGCNLALCCDIVVAAADARFSQIFVRRGLTIDGGGSWALVRRVGVGRAKELTFTGRFVSGSEGVEIGMVEHCVEPGQAEKAALEVASQIAANAPIALGLAKQLIEAGHGSSLADAVEAEARAQAICMSSQDLLEGVVAFVEKRDPAFMGR